MPGVPTSLTVQPVPSEGMTVYRVTRATRLDDSNLYEDLSSNYVAGHAPRWGAAEAVYALVYTGISVFTELIQAQAIASKWPRKGDHVAELRLPAGEGFSFVRWGSEGHMTLCVTPAEIRPERPHVRLTFHAVSGKLAATVTVIHHVPD